MKDARKIVKDGKAKMFCLAGIGWQISGIIESAKSADKIISIDGCFVMSVKKTLENTGFSPDSYNHKYFGFRKGKTSVNNMGLGKVISKISECKK